MAFEPPSYRSAERRWDEPVIGELGVDPVAARADQVTDPVRSLRVERLRIEAAVRAIGGRNTSGVRSRQPKRS